MVAFIGRVGELAALEKAYASNRAALIPIWGRRRVGKSTLVRRFLEGKPGLYFLAKETSPQAQLSEFLAAAALATGQSLLAELAPDDWKRALLRAVDAWSAQRVVLVLDELQYLAKVVQGITSILQECWDLHWKNGGKVVLILCGSEIGFMERDVLGSKSPLFGRRTAQIHLRPFGFAEAAAFHSTWSLEERAKVHFLCGGIAAYLEQVDSTLSLRRNIEELFLTPTGPLAFEADFLLREELRDVHNYHAVLLAIAGQKTTAKAIGAATGIASGSLGYYLKQLVDLGYVASRHPLTEAGGQRKKTRYIVDDALLRFWFRFVADRTSIAHQYGPRVAFDKVIAPQLEAYWGACFERLCREALPALYRSEGVSAAFEIGEYWDASVQLDVVGIRDDGWTDLGECKWKPVRSLAAVERELEAKVARFPNPRNATIGRRLFVRKAPSRVRTSHQLHSLEDLYVAVRA